jgi:protein-tyrosine-phosphatase
MTDHIRNVLFLCTGNSARSLIAESILNREGAGRFRAFSAGSHPAAAPHPLALDLLRRQGHDTSTLRSKSWDEWAAPDAPAPDFVITVCDAAAAETCPIWPGQPITAHWGVPDPVAVTGSDIEKALAFAQTYRLMFRRIDLLLNLPLATLDRLAVKRHLDQIGTTATDPENT